MDIELWKDNVRQICEERNIIYNIIYLYTKKYCKYYNIYKEILSTYKFHFFLSFDFMCQMDLLAHGKTITYNLEDRVYDVKGWNG